MIDYDKILKTLKEKGEPSYKKFNESLIPGEINSYGVRSPYLREMAKEISKDDWREFLKVVRNDSHEERMIHGMVIGCAKCDFQEKLGYIKAFVPEINNWAVCDSFCAGLKDVKKHLPRFLEFLAPYMNSSEEFKLRFAIVSLMDFYINDEYIDMVLEFMARVNHEGYYVKMAAAWGLSVCFVKFREKTLEYFENGKISDPWINNKAIQKIRESYRVEKNDKKLLLNFKR